MRLAGEKYIEGKRSARSPVRVLLCLVILAGLRIISPVFPALALEVPPSRGYVTDLAEMISPATEERLNRVLHSFEVSDSTQIAILTIPSLEGDSLEDFSIRTVDRWGIGQKTKDNGLLLLAVKNDRKIRIEVGRGLEGVMTDLMAGRIIDGIVTPLFKAGRFDEGFVAGTDAMIQVARGEFQGDRLPSRMGDKGGEEPPPFFAYLLFAAFFVAFLGSSSRVLGAVSGAILLPVIALLGLPFAFSLLMLLILIPVGAFAGLLLPLLLAGSLSHRRGGGYYGGGLGGFSGGGGGGFGGGGASGGW